MCHCGLLNAAQGEKKERAGGGKREQRTRRRSEKRERKEGNKTAGGDQVTRPQCKTHGEVEGVDDFPRWLAASALIASDENLGGVQQPLAIGDFIGPVEAQDNGAQGAQRLPLGVHLQNRARVGLRP